MPRLQRRKLVRRKVAAPLQLTPRDIALFHDLSEYRFLNTEQILALNPGGQRNMLRRLAAMYDLHFLDRPKNQDHARLRSPHTVYSLDKKGAEVMGKDAKEREGLLRRIREVKHTTPIIAHALMISQFRICLTLALKNRPDVKLMRWVQGNDLKSALGQSPELVPDAFFILKTPNRTCPCFLEADRGTMGKYKQMFPKFQKYWQHFRDKGFQKSLSLEYFRVLTITPNETRRNNLCLTAKGADDNRKGNLLYLFLSETQYSIAEPDAILKAAWIASKDDTPQSFIE